MDKDNNDSSKSFKLDKQERKILRGIDKSSKWEDVKGVKNINEEIINLDIYKDFIGLGCSRYLNESAETGKLDIEEMFRNCREAEKVRVRVRKKERKETAQSKGVGKAGLTKGNVGSNVRNEVRPKEVESKQMKESPIVDKARQISKELIEGLTKSVKSDDWKAVIARTGIKYGLEGLFGIVIGVVEYSIDNPVGAIAITPAMIGIMAKIYEYLYESSTGKKVVGNITDWFNGKLNELIDYLTGKGINVVKKKGKKKKKKPFDRGGGGGKKDDDDDDDDDSGGGDFTFDFDELDSYEGETETKKEAEEEVKKDQQDLTPQDQQQQAQGGVFGQLLSAMGSQLAQAQTQLINTNTARLFQQNKEQKNPLPDAGGEELTPPPRKDKPPNPTEDKEDPKPQDPLSGVSGGLFTGMGVLGSALGGGHIIRGFREQLHQNQMNDIIGGMRGRADDMLGNTPQMRQLNPIREGMALNPEFEALVPEPEEPLLGRFNTPQQLRDNNLNEPPVEPEPESNNLNRQGEMTDERREQEEMLKKQEEDRKKQEETERKVNQQIEDMDIRGRAWGSVLGGMSRGGGSKVAQQQHLSIIPMYNRVGATTQTETLGSLLNTTGSQTEALGSLLTPAQAEEERSLLGQVEDSANQMFLNAMDVAEENERLNTEIGLIKAQAGEEAERKMTAKEAEIMEEQRLGEEKARTNRLFNIDRGIEVGQTTMNALTLQQDNTPPQQQFLTPPEETLRMIDEDRDAQLTQRQRMDRLQMTSLQNVMSNNRYQGQSLMESTLAGEMILGGTTRGRPRADTTEPDARKYLIQVVGVAGRDITINQLRGFFNRIDPNDRLSSDLQDVMVDLQKRVDKQRQEGRIPDYKLKEDEITAIANIIRKNELRREREEPPRQKRSDMGKGSRKKK